MKVREILNNRYAQKCQELADVLLNIEKMKEREKELRHEIEVLNEALPVCLEMEVQLTQPDTSKEPGNE